MNPDLLKATALLLAREAKAPPGTVTDANRDAFIKAATGGKFGWAEAKPLVSGDFTGQNLVRSALQGATGNYTDELMSHMPAALGGGADQTAIFRAADKNFQREHPVADFVARGAGQLATLAAIPWEKVAAALGPVVPAVSKMLPEASTAAGAAARAALSTGAVGAVDASGQGSGMADRAKRAVIGGLTGSVLGGVVGGAAGKVAEHLPARAAARRVTNAVDESGGIQKVIDAAKALDAAKRGDVAMLGDLSGNLQRATDYAANNNPNIYASLADKMNARQATMGDRMLQDAEDLTGSPNAEAESRALKQSNRDWADHAYDGLRAQNPEVPLGPVEPMTKQPVVEGQFKGALDAGQIGTNPEPPYVPPVAPDPAALEQLGQRLGSVQNPMPIQKVQEALTNTPLAQILRAEGSGDLVDAALGKAGTNPSFRALLSLKNRLSSLSSAKYAANDGDMGRALQDAHDALIDHLRNTVDGFAKINDEFAARKRLEEAITGGVDAWNNPKTRLLSSDLQQLPAAEQDLFRRAMASELVDWLRSVSKNQNEAGRVVNASKAMEDKLHALFGDEATFDQYINRAKAELQMNRTKLAVGGSQTHLRDAESMFDPLDLFMHGTPSPKGLWMTVMRATKGKLTAATAQRVGNMVGTQGTNNIVGLLQSLAQPQPLVSSTARKVGAATAGSLFSQF